MKIKDQITIKIKRSTLAQLVANSEDCEVLTSAGVDNWDGCEDVEFADLDKIELLSDSELAERAGAKLVGEQ